MRELAQQTKSARRSIGLPPRPTLFTLPERVLRLCITIQVRATYRGIDPIAKQKISLQLDHGINAITSFDSGLWLSRHGVHRLRRRPLPTAAAALTTAPHHAFRDHFAVLITQCPLCTSPSSRCSALAVLRSIRLARLSRRIGSRQRRSPRTRQRSTRSVRGECDASMMCVRNVDAVSQFACWLWQFGGAAGSLSPFLVCGRFLLLLQRQHERSPHQQ